MASRPDRQTLLIVSEGTVIGIPAATAACRDGIWPAPGLEHLAHDHVVDLVTGDPGPVERRLDRDAAELGTAEVR